MNCQNCNVETGNNYSICHECAKLHNCVQIKQNRCLECGIEFDILEKIKRIKCYKCKKEILHGKTFGERLNYEIDYNLVVKSFVFEHLNCDF